MPCGGQIYFLWVILTTKEGYIVCALFRNSDMCLPGSCGHF
jgi:hypothetical protein